MRGFSLIEVLISVFLIVVVMASLLKVSDFSIDLSERLSSDKQMSALASCINLDSTAQDLYFSDLYNLKDDDLRRHFKPFKLKIRTQDLASQSLMVGAFEFNVKATQVEISSKEGEKISIVRFKLP